LWYGIFFKFEQLVIVNNEMRFAKNRYKVAEQQWLGIEGQL